MRDLVKSLLEPTAYPEPTTSVELIQTHVSLLFLTDRYVYKIKKPVDFGFLNFRTIDRRRFYCNEEIRLNSRLSPELYLGVVEVRECGKGFALHGSGQVVDYAVKMHRLPRDRMLDRLVADNSVTSDDIRRIARRLGDFHLQAESGEKIAELGGVATIRRNWEENFSQLAPYIGSQISENALKSIRSWVESFLREREKLLTDRVTGGFIRDCDGDLHLDNICLAERVYIFDCIEFNERFRYSDTAADIAFLLMDLDAAERDDLSFHFLDEYVRVTGDRSIISVLPFYKVYRAVVRGKIECFKTLDPELAEIERADARKRARRYFELARRYILADRFSSALFVTCGPMGSGKSTIAAALSIHLGLAVLSSDRIRKEFSAVPPGEHRYEPYGIGIYSDATSRATYAELARRTSDILASGKGVIVDATFQRERDRSAFRTLAEQNGVPFRILSLKCPEECARLRLEERELRNSDPSDGRWELFRQQVADFSFPTSDEGTILTVDMSLSLSEALDQLFSIMEND